MYEAVFTVSGASAYETATADTDTTIELWCNDHCDLLLVSGEGHSGVVQEVRETVGIGQRFEQGNAQTLITEACLKDRITDNIERFIGGHDCLLLPPLTYAAGQKRARILALDADSLSAFYEELSGEFDVQVRTKGPFRSIRPDAPFLPISGILPDFTARQRQVFEKAYNGGYYELPRETTTEAIADKLGIHRRTAETHLRVAERKLVEAVADYL